MDRTQTLIAELTEARADFFAALDQLDRDALDRPGVEGDWSARELIAHLGYWAGHAVEAIHAVEDGRAATFGLDRPSVEEINSTVARVARQAELSTVRKREAASVDALLERLQRMDPSLLDVELPEHRLTLEEAIREDGVDHYREHADKLRGRAAGA